MTSGKGPRPKITVDGHPGGEITEIAADGSRHIWGHIISWIPGSYLAFKWHPGRDASEATYVSITFEAHADGTKLTLPTAALTFWARLLTQSAPAI